MSDLMFFGTVMSITLVLITVIGYIQFLRFRLEQVKGEAYFNKQMWDITEKHLKESHERTMRRLK